MNKTQFIKDYLKFGTNNKFQWYITIIVISTLLTVFGLISRPAFESIFKYVSTSLFVAEGANQLTNIRKS
ncbi:MAG: hypothetical protein ACQEQF_00290 [Bacillota bacterium]